MSAMIAARAFSGGSGGESRADGPADDADGAGEFHPVGVDVSLGCGLADQPGDGPVRQQVAVDFLACHVRAPGPQYPSGPAQMGLELVVSGLMFPPLVI